MIKGFLLISIFFSSFILSAKMVYVNSFQAIPNIEPVITSKKTNIVLKRGDTVDEIAQKNGWSRIKSGSATGWLPSIILSQNPPMKKISPLDKDIDISTEARKRASGYTTAAAARGLRESGRKRISSMQQPDFDALKKVESNVVNEKDAVEYTNFTE